MQGCLICPLGAGDGGAAEAAARPVHRSEHLELDLARRQAGCVHGVVAGQGVDPQHVAGVQQNVARFQVAVQDALAVGVVDRPGDDADVAGGRPARCGSMTAATRR